MKLELTHVGLLVELANHYTTRGAWLVQVSAVYCYSIMVGWLAGFTEYKLLLGHFMLNSVIFSFLFLCMLKFANIKN